MATLLPIYIGVVACIAWVLMRQRSNMRAKMLANADAVLRRMTDPEERVEYVSFSSGWPRRKREVMKARIQSATAEGWTYLNATSAPQRMTIRSLGGGLNLTFVRERQRA